MFIGYCVGQFTGPFFFIDSEGPRYPTAFRAFYSSVTLMIFLELVLLLVPLSPFSSSTITLTLCSTWLNVQNRRRDRESSSSAQEQVTSDMTDWENRAFRYIW